MGVHGVEIKEVATGPVAVNEVPSGITAMVGIAPRGPIEQLVMVSNAVQAAQFGLMLPGFTIPQALNDHFNEGGQPVMVQNVFDPTLHTTDVADEVVQMTNGKGKLAFAPIANVIVKHTSGTPTYVLNVAYTIDDAGNIRSLDNALIAHNASIKVSYKKANIAAITSSVIIGSVDSTTNVRKGFKALENAMKLHGVEPKVIIAPEFSSMAAVVAEMRIWAARFFAMGLIDAPAGTTVPVAIAGRGPLGVINFNIADERIWAIAPRLKAYNPVTDTYEARPPSAFISGAIGFNDRTRDIHFSVSNLALKSAIGVDVEMSSSAVDPDTDVQRLNDVGIVSFIQEGSGIRIFGNRSTAYPNSTALTTFHNVRRVQDIAARSLQRALVQYLDGPMVESRKAAIIETANGYLRALQGREALIDGIAFFDPARNPVSQTSLGWWILSIRSCPPPPAERITTEWYVDVQMLNKLNSQS